MDQENSFTAITNTPEQSLIIVQYGLFDLLKPLSVFQTLILIIFLLFSNDNITCNNFYRLPHILLGHCYSFSYICLLLIYQTFSF